MFQPMFFLIFSNVGIELCGSIWDIFFRFANRSSCHDLTGHDSVDVVVWLIFKLSVVNFWFWPLFYAYSPRRQYFAERYDPNNEIEDELYQTEEG